MQYFEEPFFYFFYFSFVTNKNEIKYGGEEEEAKEEWTERMGSAVPTKTGYWRELTSAKIPRLMSPKQVKVSQHVPRSLLPLWTVRNLGGNGGRIAFSVKRVFFHS